MASSMQAALHMDPSYEKNLDLFKNSEFESIKGLFGITTMMLEGNSEIKNVFPAEVASSRWENMYCLKNKQYSGQKQECMLTRTPCYAWDNSTVQKMQKEGGMIKCKL